MKKVAALLFLLIGFVSTAQDYQFDYLLEYKTDDGEPRNYYVNSANSDYMLIDAADKQILSKDQTVFFAVSFEGVTNIYHIDKDELPEETAELIATDGKEVVINGFTCKRYLYKALVPDEKRRNKKVPVTYEFYIMGDTIDSAGIFNTNSFYIGLGYVFKNLPKGTLVKFGNIADKNFVAYAMTLVKVTKLASPLKPEITKEMIAKLLKNKINLRIEKFNN